VKASCRRLLAISLAVLLLSGCSGSTVTTKASSQVGQYKLHNIALIPFQTMATPQAMESSGPSFPVPSGARRSDMSVAVPPPTGQYARRTNLVPPAAGEKVTDLMWGKLQARPGVRVIPPREATAAARELAGSKSIDSIPTHEIAQRLGADAALSGKVLVYQERVGGRFGADPPAVVGFEAKLVAPDGNLLWEGNYYEKQRPMTEDVMGFIRRYGMFVTADELAAYGATKLAEDLPVGSFAK
jgi:hypothetical protein